MTGIIGLANINPTVVYPAAQTAKMRQFPTDITNRALSGIAADAGIEHLFDPAGATGYYTQSTGVALDLLTKGRWTDPGKPLAAGSQVNGNDVLSFTGGGSGGFDSSFTKAETSWSVFMYVEQQTADQTGTAGNKSVVICGVTNFYIRNDASSTSWRANFNNGATNVSWVMPTGGHILLVSYDAVTKGYSIRNTDDTVFVSGTLAADPANGGTWSIGGNAGATRFQGRIGTTVICSKAHHLAANDTIRTQMQSILKAKYGL